MTTPQIELIDCRLIDESPMNPRKFFNTESIRELSESISKQGLLQPITVRIYKDKKILQPVSLQGKTCYEIICGARRYRASVLAGMKVIPCIVKEMTDEQAFDAMITENLQRKDVAPMDEARAFFELHKRDVSFEELAARFGKSVQFIRLRIKLNELVPGLVELLEKKELQLTHAQELCKLDPERQNALLKDRYSCDSDNYYSWKYKPLKNIIETLSSNFKDLEDAKFDKSDCRTCEFRCGFNALFSEYNENRCTSTECYDEKVKQYYFSLIDEKVSQGFLLVKQNSLHTSMQEICKELEVSGRSITERNYENSTWENIVEMPERDEDDTDEEWDEAIQEYNDDLAKQNERFENGYQKAFQIEYNGVSEILVKFKENSILNSGENISEQSIKELQGKDKRNAEIKGEKIIEDLRSMMSTLKYESLDHELSDTERFSMFAFMLLECCTSKTEIEKGFEKDLNYLSNVMKLTPKVFNKIVRGYLKQKSTSGDVTYSKNVQNILTALCGLAYPDETTRIELKHEDTYLKRKERIDEQIKSLS